VTKIMETSPAEYADALAVFESCFKDLGASLPEIKDLVAANLPPPPTPQEEIDRRNAIAAELERLQKEEEKRERRAAGIIDEEDEEEEDLPTQLKNKNLDGAMGSRRGSATPTSRSRQGSITIGGLERRGSYYDDDVTKRATVAVVTDDPDHKDKLKKSLSQVFNDGEEGAEGNGMSSEELQSMLSSGAPLDKDKIMNCLPVGVSEESRALMEQILNSNASQDEINNRVAALLAGTALSNTRGELRASRYGEIKPETYDVDGVKSRRGERAGIETDIQNGGVTMRAGGVRGGRTSIKRQSEILRDSRKRAEEREEERQRKKSYYRQIAGLRKAKVPLMVYSCGGFSRCFRVAKFYDVEGPPVGVVYTRPENDARQELNPEL